MVDREFEYQLRGWSLTTAEILYRMPDHRGILQTFVWQEYDHAPRFPRLIKFLDFWSHNLDGPLASIRIAHAGLVGPRDFRYTDHELRLH